MRVIYLDQNKWIELARSAKYPAQYPDAYAVLNRLLDDVGARRIAVPLSFANIYETHKINDRQQRHELAFLQAALSGGLVFRGRYKRLEIELGDFVRASYGMPPVVHSDQWFLSDVFFEAVAEADDKRLPSLSKEFVEFIRGRPAEALYDYLVNTPEAVRRLAVQKFSEGAHKLRERIEQRRKYHANESMAMRRKIYSALLMTDEIELILSYGKATGVPWQSASDIGSAVARRMMLDVPTYHIEREITLRLETQQRDISENDFRDMQAFCSVLAYADYVVAENQFSSLAIQAGLHKKYGTEISTDISSLRKVGQAATEPAVASS